jgi:hypothetical protein
MDPKAQIYVALIAFAGASIGGAIVAVSNWLLKKFEYRQGYYRLVIQKRLVAYEKFEALIVALKTAVMDKDQKPYHLLFASENDWPSAYKILNDIASEALWLSAEAFDASKGLDYLMFRHDRKGSMVDFGKTHYQEIAKFRENMERVLVSDILTLHDVKGFLRRKARQYPQDFVPLKYSDTEGLKIDDKKK